jgi:hypothetical protein
MLEHQCGAQKGEDVAVTASTPTTPSRTADNLSGNTLKYIAGAPIPQQPMLLASILSALKLVSYKVDVDYYI